MAAFTNKEMMEFAKSLAEENEREKRLHEVASRLLPLWIDQKHDLLFECLADMPGADAAGVTALLANEIRDFDELNETHGAELDTFTEALVRNATRRAL